MSNGLFRNLFDLKRKTSAFGQNYVKNRKEKDDI